MLDLVKEWRARVRMLFMDHTAQGREGVNRFLELLKAGCVFCHVATGEEDELGGMDKEYRELVEEVKEQEAKYQGKQNTELEFKFFKLQDEFRDALTTRADREIKKASSNGGDGGVDWCAGSGFHACGRGQRHQSHLCRRVRDQRRLLLSRWRGRRCERQRVCSRRG